MAAISVTIGNAVVSQLEAATLPIKICPVRSYADWELTLTKVGVLHVDVVAHTTEQIVALSNQNHQKFEVSIDIAVRKRFSTEKTNDETGRLDIEEVDALVELVEEIHSVFTKERLTDFGDAIHRETRIIVCPDRKALKDNRQFTSVVRVIFRTDKQLA